MAMMRFMIRYDLTNETFTVEGRTADECRRLADEECERRGWNLLEVGSERIEDHQVKRELAFRNKEQK